MQKIKIKKKMTRISIECWIEIVKMARYLINKKFHKDLELNNGLELRATLKLEIL